MSGRSSSGCWTCRVRRKKCDEQRPVCDICLELHITCNYGDKPAWMDGGREQEAMVNQIKNEVKQQAPYRRRRRSDQPADHNHVSIQVSHSEIPSLGNQSEASYTQVSGATSSTDAAFMIGTALGPSSNHSESSTYMQNSSVNQSDPSDTASRTNTSLSLVESSNQSEVSPYMQDSSINSSPNPSDVAFPTNTNTPEFVPLASAVVPLCKQIQQMRPFAQSDSVLLVFYLERILPFLFPFYRPAPLEGGRAWILDLVISSPVVRQAILCQSSYFFAIAHGTSNTTDNRIWEALNEQTRDAFNILRNSIQVIGNNDVNGHIHGNVRTMAAVMQLQRFEIAITCFDNCQAHLNAALSIFRKVIDTIGAAHLASSTTTFHAILSLLGPPAWILPNQEAQVSSAEQAAFCFSTALLLFDDIIASTALQERPQLYDYHHILLCKGDGIDSVPPINLGTTIGCQNWVLKLIGEIAALDAWKKDCKAAGNLDVGELVHRATFIKQTLEAHVSNFETDVVSVPQESSFLDDMFAAEDYSGQARTIARQSSLVTRVWAHATFLYLSVVISGWQPANTDVRHHVAQVLELLTHQLSPPALLRTMAWPFCVVGCLTEPAQQARVVNMVDSLQPASRFSTLRRGFGIIEKVWNDRAMGNAGEFATYFQSDATIVLLV